MDGLLAAVYSGSGMLSKRLESWSEAERDNCPVAIHNAWLSHHDPQIWFRAGGGAHSPSKVA